MKITNEFLKSNEPLLQENPDRLVLYPLQYPDIWEMYQTQQNAYWVAEDVKMDDDRQDWKKLTNDEKYFIKSVLAFFAGSDAIVNDNLVFNMLQFVQSTEAQFFYVFQAMMENIHSTAYSMMIDSLIDDYDERKKLFNGITNMESVQKKANWAYKWIGDDTVSDNTKSFISDLILNINDDEQLNTVKELLHKHNLQNYNVESPTFLHQLIAFACVEGIFFSGSFCSIFWLKKRGLMSGLSTYNEYISRDEGLHYNFAVHIYNNYIENKLTTKEVQTIILEALEIEKEFITESLPVNLIGMNNELMSQYIEYVTKNVLEDFGCNIVLDEKSKKYGQKLLTTKNPFPWMVNIALEGKTNFFEKTVSDYQIVGVQGQELNFDADF